MTEKIVYQLKHRQLKNPNIYLHNIFNERNELIKKIQARNEQLLTRAEEKLDEIDMFFRGLAITAKKFPSKGRIEAKKKYLH